MDFKESKENEVKKPEGRETVLDKIRDLAEDLKEKVTGEKKPMSLEECGDALSKRLEGKEAEQEQGMHADEALNKQAPDIGLSGCEGYCRKVRDGTRVHGTYYV